MLIYVQETRSISHDRKFLLATATNTLHFETSIYYQSNKDMSLDNLMTPKTA